MNKLKNSKWLNLIWEYKMNHFTISLVWVSTAGAFVKRFEKEIYNT